MENDGVQDDKYCGKLISGCSCDEENDESILWSLTVDQLHGVGL